MSQKPQIAIPMPCHENWDAMAVVDKGRFCANCEKQVYDFTKSSDREIIAKFKSDGNVCGRFLGSQLNRDLVVPKEKSFQWMIAASGVLTFLGNGNQVSAQVNRNTVQTDSKSEDTIQNKSQSRTLLGIVFDETGPLQGANVLIRGTSRGTSTDANGRFKIDVEEGQTLVAYKIGMLESEWVVNKTVLAYQFNLKENLFQEEFVVGYPDYDSPRLKKEKKTKSIPRDKPERTFFGRILHSIGNSFR